MRVVKMESLELSNGDILYVDLNDVLDILDDDKNAKGYIVIFEDGSQLCGVNIKKSVINKFIKLKEKRNKNHGSL